MRKRRRRRCRLTTFLRKNCVNEVALQRLVAPLSTDRLPSRRSDANFASNDDVVARQRLDARLSADRFSRNDLKEDCALNGINKDCCKIFKVPCITSLM